MVTKMVGSQRPAVLNEKDKTWMRLSGHRYRDHKLAELLKAEGRVANQRRKLRLLQQNVDRLIPTSGPERRRAKAHRQQGLCLGPGPGLSGRCQREAVEGYLCDAHQPTEANAAIARNEGHDSE